VAGLAAWFSAAVGLRRFPLGPRRLGAPVSAACAGFVVVVLSLAAREARPGRVTLGMRIRGMSLLPSGMAES
jgi:hypothetical protein